MNTQLLKRLGITALGQALPEASVLEDGLSATRSLIITSIIAGILCAALTLMGGYGFYHWLIAEGLSPGASFGVTAGILALISLLCLKRANDAIQQMSSVRKNLRPFANVNSETGSMDSLITSIVSGFVTCLTQPQPPADEKDHASMQDPPEDEPRAKRIILVKE